MRKAASRTGKVAFVAHCLLNQNAMVAELPRFPGVITPVIDLLREKGYELEQLPCPEVTYLGLRRWWSTRDIYDNPGYRRHCRYLAEFTADSIARYIGRGYEVVLIGLDGSPSSGVRYTGATEREWGGRPNASREEFRYVPGRGIWMEELERELNRRGLAFPRATGILLGDPNFDLAKTMVEMREFVSG